MDSTEPPRIVLERPEVCTNPDRVEAELHASLERARTPTAAWSLGVTLERLNPQQVRARAGISDGRTEVARRVLSSAGDDCEGLARAVGVWASLVFEAEVARAEARADRANGTTDPELDADAAPENEPGDEGRPGPTDRSDSVSSEDESSVREPPSETSSRAAPARPSMSIRGADVVATAAERLAGRTQPSTATLEVSGGAFTMFGMVDSVANGFALDATLAVSESVFLRPAFFAGLTTGWVTETPMTAVRLDVCTRFGPLRAAPALEVDPCWGAETGALLTPPSALAHGALGPGVDLRQRFGRVVSAVVRATGGANFAKPSELSTRRESTFSGRMELALSFGVW